LQPRVGMRRLIAVALCLLAGCEATPELLLLVKDGSQSEPTRISLEHGIAVRYPPRASGGFNGDSVPGGTVVYLSDAPVSCLMLEGPHTLGPEHVVLLDIPDTRQSRSRISVYGPADGSCGPWAVGEVDFLGDVELDEVVGEIDGRNLSPDDESPWAASHVRVEGALHVPLCRTTGVLEIGCEASSE